MNQELASKLEFELKDLNEEQINFLNNKLSNFNGVKNHEFNKKTNRLYLESTIPTVEIHQELEKMTDSSVVLRGMGTFEEAAVAEIISTYENTEDQIRGVIRFVQIDHENCAIDGVVDGLTPGNHALTIFENGDISNGFENLGNHFNPLNQKHGLSTDEERHVGDLGNIYADKEGRASFRFVNKKVKLWDVIGRSICISENPESRSAETGEKLACGIIARSSKIFDNVKKICLCSGKTIWDERKQAHIL